MLFLKVPYAEKDKAKALGARWNPTEKKWYITDRNQYYKFTDWIDGYIVACNYIYLLEGIWTCFRCRQHTRVIGFGFKDFYEFRDTEHSQVLVYISDDIHIAADIDSIPPLLSKYLKTKYNYYFGYSRTVASNYYGNHCNHCGVLQGRNYLFDEVDTPFWIDENSAKKLLVYPIRLENDVALHAEIGYGSEDYRIIQESTFVENNLKWE